MTDDHAPSTESDDTRTFTLAEIGNLPGNLTGREIYLHLKHKDDKSPRVEAITLAAQTVGSLAARVATPETVNTLVALLAKAEERIAELTTYVQSGQAELSE